MSDPGFPLLTAIILTPAVGAVLLLFVARARDDVIRMAGIIVSLVTAGLVGYLLYAFKTNTADYQFVSDHQWIQSIGVRYIVGVDGISLFMVGLTALLFPLALLASAKIDVNVKAYTFFMLMLEAGILGVFLSLDLILFFVFWEVVLVPMYFIIAGWGHERRVYVSIKFFLYTMAGSALMLVAIIALAYLHASNTGTLTFDLRVLQNWDGLATNTGRWLFLAFSLSFAIKVPVFPFHTWLPDAHVEAPTAGSVILAGLLLKMGTYGFLRFCFTLFPEATVHFRTLFLVLATIGILYGAIVATVQRDLKKLIAYSSVAHLGFVILGAFALTTIGIQGGVFTMVSHGLTTGALFLLVGIMYERRHTRLIADFGGIWKIAPRLGGFFLVAMFASIGLPGMSGFVGEYLSLVGTFIAKRPYAIVAAVGVILAAVYLLWAFQRVFTGEPTEANRGIRDLDVREMATVLPLLGLTVFLGIYPKPLLDRVEPSARALVAHVEQRTTYVEPQAPWGGVPAAADATDDGETETSQEEGRWSALLGANGYVAPDVPWLALSPVIALSGGAMVIVALLALRHRVPKAEALAFPVALVSTVVGIGMLFPLWRRVVDGAPHYTFGGMFLQDSIGTFLDGVVLVATLLAIIVAFGYLRRSDLDLRPEYFVLVLLSATGMMAMASAGDLIIVFVALEVLSIPLYVLAGFRRDRPESQEASLKYFVLGAFASAIFLYGVALVYGATGSTQFGHINEFLRDAGHANTETLLVGIVLMIVGLGFKIAAVPFHVWTPDVYQGSPTPVTAFMAAGAKTAGFAALIRVLYMAVPTQHADWRPVIWVLAVLTLVVASATAILQTDVKRMLAYSSIGHAGFILLGLHAYSIPGLSSVLFYLATYAVMIVGTFAVVTVLAGRDDDAHDLADYRGLAQREPMLSGLLAFFLFVQAGIPLTSGFIAKLQVFTASIQNDTIYQNTAGAKFDDKWSLSLAIIGVLASVVAAFIYLRLVVTMYAGSSYGQDHGDGDVHAAVGSGGGTMVLDAVEAPAVARVRVDVGTWLVILVAAGVTLVVGVYPGPVIDLADTAVRATFSGDGRRGGAPMEGPLRDAVAEALGSGVVGASALGGGDVARAYRVELADGRTVFAKTHADPPPGFFVTEATGLRWLRDAGAVAVPEVLAVADGGGPAGPGPVAFLALQWIDEGRVRGDDDELGRGLAALHRAGAPCFGREDRRPTGSRSLPNDPASTWAEFYAERRLLPLVRLARDGRAVEERVLADVERLAGRLAGIGAADEAPARLHGDLWAGNRLVDRAGRSWLVDPAAHGGHREFDLAMMRLFGGFGPGAFTAYAEVFPLADGWEDRVPLHQLAPLLVHAIKFGGSYPSATARAVAASLDL